MTIVYPETADRKSPTETPLIREYSDRNSAANHGIIN
jgi:hypothetical protein